MGVNRELAANEIHLWITLPEQINDQALLARYRSLLTDEEMDSVNCFKFPHLRHQALVTRIFARTVLSEYADISPRQWQFVKGARGKPEVVNPPFPLRFNLSHATGMIICAVGLEHDLGADVESMERSSDLLNIANRYFSPVEVRELFGLRDREAQFSRFFDYWTLKESYIKAWGLGLSIPLDHFSFHIGQAADAVHNDNIRLSFSPQRNDDPNAWQSWLYYPNQTHRMAISIRNQRANNYKVRFFNTTPLLSNREITLPFNLEESVNPFKSTQSY